MRIRSFLHVFGALALCSCGAIPGTLRPGPQPAPGQRVRVRIQGAVPPSRIGTFVALTADSLVLGPDTASSVATDVTRTAVPVAAVTRFEVSTGVRHHAAAGAAIGGGIVLLGSLVGLAAGACVACEADITAVFVGGLVVGGAIGALVEKEDWRRRRLSTVRLTLVPLPSGGLGLGASWALRR